MKRTRKLFYHLFAIMLMCTLFCVTKASVNAQEVYQGFAIDGVPQHLTSNLLTKGEHTLSMEGYEEGTKYNWETYIDGMYTTISTDKSIKINITDKDKIYSYNCDVTDKTGYTCGSHIELRMKPDVVLTKKTVNGVNYDSIYDDEKFAVICDRNPQMLSVSATSPNADNLTFEWCFQNYDEKLEAPIKTEKGTTSSFEVPKVEQYTAYCCVISDGGAKSYEYFRLTPIPFITSESYINGKPYSVDWDDNDNEIYQDVPFESKLEMKSTTTENEPITYQWYELDLSHLWEVGAETKIEGATLSTYTIPKEKQGKAGYKCIASVGKHTDQCEFFINLTDMPMPKPDPKPEVKPDPKPEEKPQTQPTVTDTVKAGEIRVVAGTSYKVLNEQTVQFKQASKTAAKVVIPSVVTIQEKNYKVTEIASKAFKNNKKTKQVVIPTTVKKIGKQAFFNCKKLKKITVKTKSLTKKSVAAKAFKGVNPKVTIKVPKAKVKAYQKLFRAKGLSRSAKVR